MDRVTPPLRCAATAALVCALAGCVERRIFITSDPPGADVTLNDLAVGRTPLEVDFVYFGKYDIRVAKPGYETLLTSGWVNMKPHDLPGLDLVAEALPHRFRTHAQWHFTLREASTDPDELIARAAALRDQLGGAPAPAVEAPEQEPIVIDELSEIERREGAVPEPPVEPPAEPPGR